MPPHGALLSASIETNLFELFYRKIAFEKKYGVEKFDFLFTALMLFTGIAGGTSVLAPFDYPR